MIITCPSCGIQFGVPSDAITPEGRKVKCSKCAHSWLQKPLEEDAEQKISAENKAGDTDAKADIKEDTKLPKNKKIKKKKAVLPDISEDIKVGFGWKAAFVSLLICCFLIAPFSLRSAIPLPPELYKTLGLEPMSGLAFTNISMAKQRVKNKYILHLGGKITNESDIVQEPPVLHMKVLSRGGNVLLSNDVVLSTSPLQPGDSIQLPDEITGISGASDRLALDIGTKWEMLFR